MFFPNFITILPQNLLVVLWFINLFITAKIKTIYRFYGTDHWLLSRYREERDKWPMKNAILNAPQNDIANGSVIHFRIYKYPNFHKELVFLAVPLAPICSWPRHFLLVSDKHQSMGNMQQSVPRWFMLDGLVSLFHGISTFVGYLIPNLFS